VAQRIERYYRRQATVIPPPIAVGRFSPAANPSRDYYLVMGELTSYKRADLAVEAFRNSNRRLVIAGDGPEAATLRKSAPANITFAGRVSDGEQATLYANCRALIFPGEEDFGMVPVEAMASGRPVVAFRSGGALDYVVDGVTGVFFRDQTPASLRSAVDAFEQREAAFDPAKIRSHAQQFSEKAFQDRMWNVVADVTGYGGTEAKPAKLAK
jgi:glycosyltransferase involved in cell wall biosynthesis